MKKLIPVGAAAAIAAAFNTPLAAVVFSLEEIMGDLNAPLMGGVVLASATAWVVLRLSLGDHPLFKVPQYHLVSPAEFGVYAVLGVAGGMVSAVFAKLLLGMRARFLRLPQNTAWFHPLVGGLLVGAMGWFVPQVLGVGYGFVGDALNGNMAVRLMLVLLVLKLIRGDDELCVGQCRRHLWAVAVSWRDAGRRGGDGGTPLLSRDHCVAWRVRAGGDGRGVRGRGARADDLGADHL